MRSLQILKVLEKYSEQEKPLTYKEIIYRLEDEFNESCSRRTVSSHIKNLQSIGCDIIKTREGCYLNRDFEDSELRILIDSVLFSKNISNSQAERLIEKLKNLGSQNFHFKINHVYDLSALQFGENKDFMRSVDLISDAVNRRKKIIFIYNHYVRDKKIFKLEPVEKNFYKVSPYQMVAANGFYYLIANTDGQENLSHWRIDKMTNVKIISEEIIPRRFVKEIANGGFNLPKHMAENIYMMNGEIVWTKFWISKKIVDDFVDYFGTGKNFKILRETDEKFFIETKVNFTAMKFWCMQFGENVEIISPKKLREEIKISAQKIFAVYS